MGSVNLRIVNTECKLTLLLLLNFFRLIVAVIFLINLESISILETKSELSNVG